MRKTLFGTAFAVIALGAGLYIVRVGPHESVTPITRETVEALPRTVAIIGSGSDLVDYESVHENDIRGVDAFQSRNSTTPKSFQKQPLSAAEERYLSVLYGEEPADDAYKYLHQSAATGDPDGQYFSSELLKYCTVLLKRYEGRDRAEMERELEELQRTDIALYESSVANFDQHYAQYTRCREIGRRDFLSREGNRWYDQAVESRHPVALAKTGADLSMESVAKGNLDEAKALVREALSRSNRQEVIEAASSVASRAMNQHDPVEEAAWAILNCQYNGCEELSQTSRSVCEIRPDAFPCYEGATEWDFLIAQYGEHFDAARARAGQLREAIDNHRWTEVHLK